MAAPVEFSCSQCSRTGKKAAHILAWEVENNRARCDYCGGALEFPPGFQAQIDAANDFGGLDLRDTVTYSCPQCVRPIESTLEGVLRLVARGRTRCQICANSLVFPAAVVEAIKRENAAAAAAPGVIRYPCPICTKPIAAAPTQGAVACTYCGAAPLPPLAAGQPWRPPPDSIPPAELDDVRAIAGELKQSSDSLCQLVYWVLKARAKRGQVSAAEAMIAKARVLRWSSWRPSNADPRYLPLELEEAEVLLPALVFPGAGCRVEDRRAGASVALVFANQDGLAKRSAAKLALEALDAGISAVATVGALSQGVAIDPGARGVGPSGLRVRLHLCTRGEGVELSLHSQYGGDAPKPMAGKVEARFLAERVQARARQVACWFSLGALFGAWVGLPCLTRVQPQAAALRLVELGWPEAKAEAAAAIICGR